MKKAVALIITCILTIFVGLLGIAVVSRSIVENRSTSTYAENVRSFWVAEAGVTRAFYNLKSDPDWDYVNLSQSERQIGENGEFNISVSSAGATTKEVTVTATIDDAYQKQITFSVDYPSTFRNAVTAGNILRGSGVLFLMDIVGNTVVGNQVLKYRVFNDDYVVNNSWITTHDGYTYTWTDDPDPKVVFPDGETDVDSDDDDFSDFKDYNLDVINEYSADEVVYIQTDSDVDIWPGWTGEGKVLVGGEVLEDDGEPVTLKDKKILYVEGNEGAGDVDILFGAGEIFNNNADMTIISTGTVTYVEPLQSGNSTGRLNVIAWEDYDEAGILLTNHNLNTYAHDDVNFLSIASASTTDGVYIANDEVNMVAVLAGKFINFPANGTVPPGFENYGDISIGNIFSAGTTGIFNKDWQQL
ncbi:MAG: hypothetical protein JW867_06020 [Candidatus Omnitrophica bacterium]|nr:hypothetical protein [Candidatus Omnitrophota bacterium]